MTRRTPTALMAVLAASLLAAGPVLAAGKVYRWVDEDGKVHYGDAIPAESSTKRHDVLNSQGTRVDTINEAPATSAARLPVPENDRDRALLRTYATPDEIELVRARRTGYLDGQNEVARDRLKSLSARLEKLQADDSDANELALVTQRIRDYEAEIADREVEIERINASFEADLTRFRELKGLAGR